MCRLNNKNKKITLLFGILFQLIVFILVLGTGVSCCGSNLPPLAGSLGSGLDCVCSCDWGRIGGGGGPTMARGGGGGGGPPWVNGGGGGGGGGHGGQGGGLDTGNGEPSALLAVHDVLFNPTVMPPLFKLCFLLVPNGWQQSLFCDGDLNSRVASSRLSNSVARCTKVSAVSHTISLTASFGSILSKCCRIDRNGISWGVSATWKQKKKNKLGWRGYRVPGSEEVQ